MNASKANLIHSADFPPFFDCEVSRNEPDSCDMGRLTSSRVTAAGISDQAGSGEAFDTCFEAGESFSGERSSGAGFL